MATGRRLILGSCILGIILLVVFAWRPPAPPAPVIPDQTAITPTVFAELTEEIERQRPAERDRLLDALQMAIDREPVAMIDALDRSHAAALREYISAMVAADRTEALGHQAYLLLRGGAREASVLSALAASETRDGGIWYPLADAAGAFLGEIGAALAQVPGREAKFAILAASLQTDPPHDQARLYQWLFDAATTENGTRLQSGVLQAFGLSYDKATQDSVLMR